LISVPERAKNHQKRRRESTQEQPLFSSFSKIPNPTISPQAHNLAIKTPSSRSQKKESVIFRAER
jgi:hypothetical protein